MRISSPCERGARDSALYGGQWYPERSCAMYLCEAESLLKW